MDDKNLILIPSKGRPDNKTGNALELLGYPEKWMFVCGDNDERVNEYVERWGGERVYVFKWAEEAEQQDMLDPFGVEGSGVVTARNVCRKVAESLGYARFWEMDDDIPAFRVNVPDENRNRRIEDGEELLKLLSQLSEWADECKFASVGLSLTANMFPSTCLGISWGSWIAFNLPTDECLFVPYRGRVNEDVEQAFDAIKRNRLPVTVKWLGFDCTPMGSKSGGYTEMYETDAGNYVRRTSYGVLLAPTAVRLKRHKGGYKFDVSWKRLVPKILNEGWKHVGK